MTLDGIGGRLVLQPGTQPALLCERPMIGPTLLKRLTEGRRAVLVPDVLAAVFTLCAQAQRGTARRAVRAAMGLQDTPEEVRAEARRHALRVMREQLQRLALDWPALMDVTPQPNPFVVPGSTSQSAATNWLRSAPVLQLPDVGAWPFARNGAAELQALNDIAQAMPSWLVRQLFGIPLRHWLDAWHAAPSDWLSQWASNHTHPVTQGLAAVREVAQAVAWPCRALAPLEAPADDMRALAAAVAHYPHFAERPMWRGGCAETGPWTRHGARHDRARQPLSLWERLGSRLADIAQLALNQAAPQADSPLALGALTLTPCEGIAWTEMSRGLLIHWVRLHDGALDVDTARVQRYHVVAPTEWNFHPEGAFAQWLAAQSGCDRAAIRLAAGALDPCLAFHIEKAVNHA
jgi:hypothetical protein